MSKQDGWEKRPSGWQWIKPSDKFKVEVAKVSGGYPGRPYEWSVHPLPRPVDDRWVPIGKGSTATLAEAKAKVDALLREGGE